MWIFLLALLCFQDGGSIVMSTDGGSIVLTSASDIVAEPDPISTPVVDTRDHFLVTEPWCPHCPAKKEEFLGKGWPEKNVMTVAQCKARFGFSVPFVPYEFGMERDKVPKAQPVPAKPVAVQPQVKQPPARYLNWPGWGTIDLETYNRNCNCNMCRTIRARQQQYRQAMRDWQSSNLPDDQQPCPYDVIEQMLDLMDLRQGDVLADLGCGDGRILIAAARRGIRGIGVELDHARAEIAREEVRKAGFSSVIRIVTGDARLFDTSEATVITAYLYPTLLEELRGKMATARVVASPFHEVPGLEMTQYGDVWIYRRKV